jgi:hypothetical protein
MKLYVTTRSPYARIVRIVVNERGISDRIEIIPAEVRQPNSPYYRINPSGRVPGTLRPNQHDARTADEPLFCGRRTKPSLQLPALLRLQPDFGRLGNHHHFESWRDYPR